MNIQEAIIIDTKKDKIETFMYVQNLKNLLSLLNNLSQSEKEIVNVSHVGNQLMEVNEKVKSFESYIVIPNNMLKSFCDALSIIEWAISDEENKQHKNKIKDFKQITLEIKQLIKKHNKDKKGNLCK